jgi:DNA-binding transcriptional regulator YiaG
MCKHVAAVLYGVGARLDKKPELLFVLRKVDHEALISAELDMQTATTGRGKRRRLANQDLSNMFGIDIEDTTSPVKKKKSSPRKSARSANNGKSDSKNTISGRGKSRTGNAKATSKKRTFTPTSTAVARLRKQFGMTRSQFADLLGVTPQTVASWESKRGRLKLQERTLKTLTRAWLQQ